MRGTRKAAGALALLATVALALGPTAVAGADIAQPDPVEVPVAGGDPATLATPEVASATPEVADADGRVRIVVSLDGGSVRHLDDVADNASDEVEVSKVYGTDHAVVEVPAADAARVSDELAASGADVMGLDPMVHATLEPNDPNWPAQNGFGPAGITGAWDVTTGADTIIAIVDTGVTPVSELAGRVLPGYDFVDSDNNAADENAHGTQAATVAAGAGGNGIAAAGVCWSCRILPVRVLDASGSGSATAVASGINYARTHGARVISLSLGTPTRSPIMDAAVASARAAGIVVVGAAGNSSTTVESYPGAHPDAIGVAAVTAAGQLFDYSNRGAWVDVAAPGLNVAQKPNGTVSMFNGTSSATPVVAGIAALALAADPSRTADDVVSLITGSGPTFAGIGGPLVDARRVAVPAGQPDFGSVAPARLLDTRGLPTVDGQQPWVGRVAAGNTVELPVTGRGGVPAWADSVVLNVTAVEPDAYGFVTAWPCGTNRPLASNLNYDPGQTVPNLVVSKIGVGGKVCLFAAGGTQLVADVAAYLPAGADFGAMSPSRLLDTRGLPTVDGWSSGVGAVSAGQIVELPVVNRGGVPGDAGSVVVNVTAADPTTWGYVTVFPCGAPVPVASNLNFEPGRTVPNLVVSEVGAGGKVCLYSAGTTQLIADVAAWFPTGADFAGASPVRLLDTRQSPTVDGAFQAQGTLAAGGEIRLAVTGRAQVPVGATAVVLNVTAASPSADGFVTVWPCGALPLASNLNFTPGHTVPNLVMAPVSADGKVCLYTAGATDLVADVAGWFKA